MKVSKTILTKFTVDLEDWYEWSELKEMERFEKLQWIQDNPSEILDDGGIQIFDKTEEVEIIEWDIEDELQ